MSSTRMATTRLHGELDTLSQNMLLDRSVESEISTVLTQVGKAVSNRKYFDSCRNLSTTLRQ